MCNIMFLKGLMAYSRFIKRLLLVAVICLASFQLYQTVCHALDFPDGREGIVFYPAQSVNGTADKQRAMAAKAFIQSMGDDVVATISDELLSREEKKKRLAIILNRNFDMSAINRFTMGRYWQQMTPVQQKEYARLYEQMIVSIYADKFSKYQGEVLDVADVLPMGTSDFIVQSYIVRRTEHNVAVDWRVRFKKDEYKILDVSIENVSMIITQKADFASAIQKKGGDPAVVIGFLRSKLH